MTPNDHRKLMKSDTAAKVRLAGHMLDYLRTKHKDLDITIPELVDKMSHRDFVNFENEKPVSDATTFFNPYVDPRIVSWTAQSQNQTLNQTLPLSPPNLTREGYELVKSTLRPKTVEPFNLRACFHTAVLNLQTHYTTEVIDQSRMFTMVENCYPSGAIGRSQERLTAADWAEIQSGEADEEKEDEKEEDNGDVPTDDRRFDDDCENDEEDVEEELIYEIRW